MKLLAAILLALSLLAAGCGDDDEDEPANDAPAQTTPKPAAPAEPQASAQDEEEVQEVVKTWLIEGDCDLMSNKFLESQLIGLGDTRQERCDLFEKQHQKPQYGEDDIKITDVRVTGTNATLVVGQEGADIESKYSLVKNGDQWQIDAADLQ